MSSSDDSLQIDKGRLDEEWERQPEMMKDWCLVLADATLAMDRAKDALNVLEADLGRDIRADPMKYGIGKLTEDAVKQAIISSVQREKAADEYYKARHAVGVADAMVQGLEHRKRALTCLVDLHLSDYFSTATPKKGRARGVRNDD